MRRESMLADVVPTMVVLCLRSTTAAPAVAGRRGTQSRRTTQQGGEP
ncbi:MAG: hypothetical protein OXH20_09905 [bacterium]|nr:hypothetical protein [bacterium]